MHDGINASNARFMTAFAAGDSAAIGELYTDNAVFMAPNSDAVVGAGAIAEQLQGFIDAGFTSLGLESIEIEDHGDTAIEEGRYTLGTAEGTADEGKYIVVWKNDAGTWKLHKDIFNSSRPAE